MSMEKAQAAYDKAVETEAKARGTIERHETALAKKVAKFEKDYGIKLAGVDLSRLDALKWPNGETNRNHEMYWACCEIERKVEEIESAKKKLAERERITAEAFEKLGRWAKTAAVFAELPAIILEFAAQYRARCIEWLLEGAEKYRARMIEVNAIQDRNERNKARALANQQFGGTIQKVAYYSRPDARQEEAEKIAERNRVDLLTLLAARVAEKCGRVTDASDLRIGMNGEVNGRVIGDKGAATIKTIAAGGWNIQCYHFRVLVQK